MFVSCLEKIIILRINCKNKYNSHDSSVFYENFNPVNFSVYIKYYILIIINNLVITQIFDQ